MRKVLAIAASVAIGATLTPSSAAAPFHHLHSARVVVLSVIAHQGRVVRACSRVLPNTSLSMGSPTDNDRPMQLLGMSGLRGSFALPAGSLAQVWSRPGRAPVCLKAVTWDPAPQHITARITVGM